MPGPSLPGSWSFFLQQGVLARPGPGEGAWVRFSPAVWLALLSSRMGLWGLCGEGRSWEPGLPVCLLDAASTGMDQATSPSQMLGMQK